MKTQKVKNITTRQMRKGIVYENENFDGSGKQFRYAFINEQGYLEVSNDGEKWIMKNSPVKGI